MISEDLLTADQAADLLGIERRSVYTYARRAPGFPQPVMVGRTPLYDRRALLAWRTDHPARRRRDTE